MNARLLTATTLFLALVGSAVAADRAAAQDRAVVQRLTEYGRMSSREAASVVRTVTQALAANAERGGERYDRIRQAIGRKMFGDPGRTREEYLSRLEQVLERMRRGLDEELLEALFPLRPNTAALCANDFDVTMTACDGLLAAASRQRATLPYAAPDDGRALQRSLRDSRASRRDAREIAAKIREVMLGVPRILRRDERGRGLLRLLEACPGALTSRESQIRAWHVGPTEGMARCLARAVSRRRPAADARASVQLLFGLSAGRAETFLSWGAPAAAAASGQPAPQAPQAPQAAAQSPAGSIGAYLQQARDHYRGGRFRQAAAAYESVTLLEPTHPRAFAGLGTCRLRGGWAQGAVHAFRQAVQLAPGNPSFHTMLGDAYRVARDPRQASAAYRQALTIRPGYAPAEAGLRRLGPRPPAGPRLAQRPPTGGPPTARPPVTRPPSTRPPSTRPPSTRPPSTRPPTRPPASAPVASGPPATPAAPPPASSNPELDRFRGQARAHFQAGRFAQAVAVYEQLTGAAPDNAGAFAGLGASRLAAGDAAGAVVAYRTAVRLDAARSGFFSALARAQARAGDRGGAIQSLRQALAIDPENGSAQAGLRQLTGTGGPQPQVQVAGATLPETPRRDQILHVMRPIQDDIAACDPSYTGRLTFEIAIRGEDGMVSEAAMSDEALAPTPAGECMLSVVQSVQFPRFTRETLSVSYPYAL